MSHFFFFFNDTATTEIYTLSLHDALPIFGHRRAHPQRRRALDRDVAGSLVRQRVELQGPAVVDVDRGLVGDGDPDSGGRVRRVLSDQRGVQEARAKVAGREPAGTGRVDKEGGAV